MSDINSNHHKFVLLKNKLKQKKLKIFFITVLLIIPAFLILFFLLKPINENDIKNYAIQKNSSKLNLFIKENYKNKEKESLVKLAISETINNNILDTTNYLKKLFFEDINTPIALNIISTLNKKSLNVGTKEEIIDLYLKNQTKSDLSNEIKNDVIRINANETYNYFFNLIKKSSDEKNYAKSIELGNIFVNLNNPNKSKISVLIERIKTISAKILENENKIKELDTNISTLNSNKTSLESGINSLENEIDRLKNEIKDAEKYLAENQYVTLTAYIVAETYSDSYSKTYEIALPEYNYYYGKIPSTTHAYITTSDYEFTTKGWFTLKVIRLDDVEVKLKEDYGNFTQKWKSYLKISSKKQLEIDTMSLVLITNGSKISTKNSEILSEKEKISLLEPQISNIESDKNSFKEDIVNLENLIFSDKPVILTKKVNKIVVKKIDNTKTEEKKVILDENKTSSEYFTIQVASEKSYENALRISKNLPDSDVVGKCFESENKCYYVVVVRKFNDKAEAQSFMAELKIKYNDSTLYGDVKNAFITKSSMFVSFSKVEESLKND